MIERDQLRWDGDALRLYGKGPALARIVPDARWPRMLRVQLPDGRLSDMANLARAKDAAYGLALLKLNRRERRAGGAPARSFAEPVSDSPPLAEMNPAALAEVALMAGQQITVGRPWPAWCHPARRGRRRAWWRFTEIEQEGSINGFQFEVPEA